MIIRVLAFTDAGKHLAKEIYEKENIHCIILEEDRKEITHVISHAFAYHEALLFIGACGIAVRMIAPFVEDKSKDSAVMVLDERGNHCISLLSGHLGGANELTKHIASLVGAKPVITTATDVHHLFAVDEFARKNHLALFPKEGIRKISAKLLAGEKITMKMDSDFFWEGEVPEEVLPVKEGKADVILSTKSREDIDGVITLYAKPFYVGMGCKKGIPFEQLKNYVKEVDWKEVAAIASIDRKKEELGLQELACFYQVPFLVYAAEELQSVPGTKAFSKFVKETVGVETVCESSALKAAGQGATLVQEKKAENGMTYAVARREKIKLIW